MGRMFNLDSPIMQFLNKVADLMILNLITLVCCLPVFTAGASLTAMHYVLLRYVRKEEGYTVRPFFKAFKENFVQATIEWLIMLAAGIIFALDIMVMRNNPGFPNFLKYAVIGIAILAYILVQLVFPLQMRFVNPVRVTFKNALIMTIAHLPKVFLMALISLAPLVLQALSFQLTPIIIMFGFSVPGLACAYLYSPIFKKFEPEEEVIEHRDEDFFISDEMLPEPPADSAEPSEEAAPAETDTEYSAY